MTTTVVDRPLTQKQEAFCVFYHATKDRDDSYIKAGFAPKFASENAANLLKNTNVQARLAELAERSIPPADLANAAINSVIQRKIRLTEIERASYDPDKLTPGHIIAAIQEHNRMERIGQADTAVNITNDNRTVNIIVKTPEGKQVIEQLRSGKLPGTMARPEELEKSARVVEDNRAV